jgi:hypothetical protein
MRRRLQQRRAHSAYDAEEISISDDQVTTKAAAVKE